MYDMMYSGNTRSGEVRLLCDAIHPYTYFYALK